MSNLENAERLNKAISDLGKAGAPMIKKTSESIQNLVRAMALHSIRALNNKRDKTI